MEADLGVRTPRKGPMDMTGTIAQVRPADERLAERLAEEYRQARIDMGPREAAAEWFTPLLRKWRRLLLAKARASRPASNWRWP